MSLLVYGNNRRLRGFYNFICLHCLLITTGGSCCQVAQHPHRCCDIKLDLPLERPRGSNAELDKSMEPSSVKIIAVSMLYH